MYNIGDIVISKFPGSLRRCEKFVELETEK